MYSRLSYSCGTRRLRKKSTSIAARCQDTKNCVCQIGRRTGSSLMPTTMAITLSSDQLQEHKHTEKCTFPCMDSPVGKTFPPNYLAGRGNEEWLMMSHVTACPSHGATRYNDFETSREKEHGKECVSVKERAWERANRCKRKDVWVRNWERMRKCRKKRKGDDNGCQCWIHVKVLMALSPRNICQLPVINMHESFSLSYMSCFKYVL